MMRGSLLTRFFLEDGIRETDACRRTLDPVHLVALADELRGLWADLGQIARPSKSENGT